MVIKTYEDGSEITGKDLVVTYAAAAMLSGVIFYGIMKYDDWKTRRLIKKTK